MKIDALQVALNSILANYADYAFRTTDKALDAGAKVLIKKLKDASPKDSGELSRSWRVGRKYKLKRFVGNSKTVSGIPLSNILEYSRTHGNPFIKRTYNSCTDEIARAIVGEIEKGK